jgi:hypothetical protein
MNKVATIQEEIKFSENQRFRQMWLWLIMIIPLTGTLILKFHKILIEKKYCLSYNF